MTLQRRVLVSGLTTFFLYIGLLLSAGLAAGSLKPMHQATAAQDAIIGEVLGEVVHASQIQGTLEQERASSLRAALISPALKAYLASHEAEVSLTAAESRSIIDSYNLLRECRPEMKLAEMNSPFDEMFAQMLGGNIKAQRFIHLNHGGGRLLFQQAGMEAFDATHRLVLELESKGDFKFFSQEDRALALSYWTTQDHSPFLQPDPGADKAFLLDDLMNKCP